MTDVLRVDPSPALISPVESGCFPKLLSVFGVGGFMNKLFAVSAVLFAFALPSLAQGTHLSLSDQKRFDSYYSRWQSYKATNNQKEVRSMEGRMQDVYRHYGIPANTPYRNIASGGSGIWDPNRWDRDRDRDWARDRDRDRDWDRADDREHHDR